MRRAPLVLVAVTAVLVGGCGGQAQLDMVRARTAITASLNKEYDLAVTGLRCPEDVEARAGRSFRCRLSIGGRPLVVRVVQRGDEGDLRVEPAAAVLRMDRVRKDLAATVAEQLGKGRLRVDCGPDQVKVVDPGGDFDCKVSDGASTKTVTVRVRDVSGSLTYTVR